MYYTCSCTGRIDTRTHTLGSILPIPRSSVLWYPQVHKLMQLWHLSYDQHFSHIYRYFFLQHLTQIKYRIWIGKKGSILSVRCNKNMQSWSFNVKISQTSVSMCILCFCTLLVDEIQNWRFVRNIYAMYRMVSQFCQNIPLQMLQILSKLYNIFDRLLWNYIIYQYNYQVKNMLADEYN